MQRRCGEEEMEKTRSQSGQEEICKSISLSGRLGGRLSHPPSSGSQASGCCGVTGFPYEAMTQPFKYRVLLDSSTEWFARKRKIYF